MKIVLIQPPISQRKLESLAPPLGLLVLASIFEQEGCDVSVIDLNLEGYRRPSSLDPANFYEESVQKILQELPDIIGFTSMVIEAHVCLELARRVKRRLPSVTSLFGGAHFSSVATRLIDCFDFVDFVIAGDGEMPARSLIRALKDPTMPFSVAKTKSKPAENIKINFVSGRKIGIGGNSPVWTSKNSSRQWNVANIAYRTAEGATLDRRREIYQDPDDLPLPAYHLVNVNEYFSINQNRLLCLEDSRGCQLKCSFCYSPGHWGHGERRKSIERTLVEMRGLKEMGAHSIYFVGDNLLTKPDDAIELCSAITSSNLRLKWNCYGTLAQLRPEVIDAMGKANCVGVFIGVDAIDTNLQKQFNKHYFKGWSRLRDTLNGCLEVGITPTCAFMVSNLDDFKHVHETLDIAVRTKLLGCEITVNLLATYPESTHSDRHGHIYDGGTDLRAKLLYDSPELLSNNDFANSYPEFFPLHNLAAPADPSIMEIIKSCVAANLVEAFPKTLLRAVIDHELNLGEMVDIVTSKVAGRLRSGVDFGKPMAFNCLLQAVKESVEKYPTLLDIFIYEVPVLSLVASVTSSIESALLNVNGTQLQYQVQPYRLLRLPLEKIELTSPFPIENEKFVLHVAVDTPNGCRISPVTDTFEQFLVTIPTMQNGIPVSISSETYLSASRAGLIRVKLPQHRNMSIQ